MNLLHVIASLDPRTGGPVEGLKQEKAILSSAGVRIEVACCDAPTAPWLEETSFEAVHAFGPSRFGAYAYAPRLKKWLKERASSYDAVIVDGIWQYNCYAVWNALKGSKTPYYVFTHGMLDPWFKRQYPLKHLKKWLYWPWGVYPALRDAKAVLFTCEEERLRARESFWLYRAKEAVSGYGTAGVPETMKNKASVFRAAFPELGEKRFLLFLGRLHEKKGCDLLLSAFARLAPEEPDLNLVMAGPDSNGAEASLRKLAQAKGIEKKVIWTGALQGELKWGAFEAADYFCLPSHQENFGIAVAEALSCGKPTLISDKVNIWREIKEDGAGFVEPDTIEGTETALRKGLALSPEEYKAMRERAAQSFARRFHAQKAAQRLLQIIGGGNNV